MTSSMPGRRPRVTCLSYWSEEQLFFNRLLSRLPGEVTARNLSLRTRSMARLTYYLTPATLAAHLPDDVLEPMIRMELREEAAHDPRLNVDAVRRRLRLKAAKWYTYFHHELHGTDLLVVWNGFHVAKQAALHAARQLGIRTAFLELGAIPKMLAVDPRGINYGNSISGLPAETVLGLPFDTERATAFLRTPFAQRPLRTTDAPPREEDEDVSRLPARFLFFAMQVYDDTQILMYSPRFRSMFDAVTYTCEELRRYRARTGDTLQLVVKEHPSDYGRIDYTPLRQALPEVIFLRRLPVYELVQRAAAVVTINSSVGVEGLHGLRPVITLGDAFYNVPGLVRHLGAEEALADVLPEVVDRPVDAELITRYLHFLRYVYLVPGSIHAQDAAELQPAADRLLDILNDRLPWLRTPTHTADR